MIIYHEKIAPDGREFEDDYAEVLLSMSGWYKKEVQTDVDDGDKQVKRSSKKSNKQATSNEAD